MTHSASREGNIIQIFIPLQYDLLKVLRNVTLNSTPLIPNVLVLPPYRIDFKLSNSERPLWRQPVVGSQLGSRW